MNETFYVIVLVTYDYYRFQENLAVTTQLDHAMAIAKSEVEKRKRTGLLPIIQHAEISSNMDMEEDQHIWIQELEGVAA